MIITWVEKVCKGRGGGGGEQNLVEPIFVVTKLISNYFDGYGRCMGIYFRWTWPNITILTYYIVGRVF